MPLNLVSQIIIVKPYAGKKLSGYKKLHIIQLGKIPVILKSAYVFLCFRQAKIIFT